jgi:hypothetical protein
MKFKISNKGPNGTSLQEYFTCSYKDIVKRFGPPNTDGDEYKVSTEWVFESDSGEVFTVYDYKETSLYDSELPSVATFRNMPEYDWHIGARDKIGAQLFKAWFQSQVSPKSSSELFELAKEITKPDVRLFCEYCKKSPTGQCSTHAKNDGVSVLFASFRQDLKFAIMHGPLGQVETRIEGVLAKYEKYVRELCGNVESIE